MIKMVNEFKLTVVHFARPLISVLLRSERSQGLAGMHRDKAPVECPKWRPEPDWQIDAWTVAMETDAKVKPFAWVTLAKASGEGEGESRETKD